MKLERSAGILLHPTSLPGPEAVGTLGAGARAFVDRLHQAHQRWWQILPLNPPGHGGSPYSATSAFAGNPMLLDLIILQEEGWLSEKECKEFLQWSEKFPSHLFPIDAVEEKKGALLSSCAQNWIAAGRPKNKEFQSFCSENDAIWLEDFALYKALKEEHDGATWQEWAPEFVRREKSALKEFSKKFAARIEEIKWIQWRFFEQWADLRDYAANKGVKILGDLPIFVAMDSADAWARRDLFQLTAEGAAEAVAGVPPDYFSETGQRWGNPLYDWEALEKENYQWWIHRVAQVRKTVDLIRVDHFRGFESYWRVPAEAETAIDGQWIKGPKDAFFTAIRAALGEVPFVAEDLGIITDEVRELRDRQGLPGMKILQFAFDGDPDHPFLPENYTEHWVAYTGTHDNDTTVGWYQSLSPEERHRVRVYLSASDFEVLQKLIEKLWRSRAAMVLIPAQDLYGLGSEFRMNTPGLAEGNWGWRLTRAQLQTDRVFQWIGALTRETRRVS